MASFCALLQLAFEAAAWNVAMVGLDEIAVLVAELRRGQVVLLGVGVFDIADPADGVLDEGGDAVIALAADAGRPVDAMLAPTFWSIPVLPRRGSW